MAAAKRERAERQAAPAPGAFRMVLEIDVVAGREPEFEQAWRSVATVIGADPANRGQWLMRDTRRPEHYVVVSDWLDEERFRRFESSQAHVANRRALAPFRRGGSMHNTVIVAHHERAAGSPGGA